MLEYIQPMHVSVAIQKAVLVINEFGTEATVANGTYAFKIIIKNITYMYLQ